MSVVQFQSTKEFVCMLAMYKQAGAWLLPEWKQNYVLTADEYLDVRDTWEQNGIAVLDFDGQLHPTRKLARMMHNVKHARSVMKFENSHQIQYYLLGPVDILYLEKTDDVWSMRLCDASEGRKFVTERLKNENEGLLITMTLDDDGVPMKKIWKLGGSEEREAVLREHMNLFYEHKWLKQRMTSQEIDEEQQL